MTHQKGAEMYEGKVIIIDNRLNGRFDSNVEYKIKPTKYKWYAILKVKLKAMYLDYFKVPSHKHIVFQVKRGK